MTIDHTALAARGDAHQTGLGDVMRAITPEDIAPYADRLAAWDAAGGLEADRTRHHYTATIADILRAPRQRSFSIPAFFAWLRSTGQAPFVPTRTSPQQVFASEQEMFVAYHAWVVSEDPRLPDSMAAMPMHSFMRGDGGSAHEHFDREIRRSYDVDRFEGDSVSNYAAGFWRDVRDLGWGTPAFVEERPTTTTEEPTVTAATVEQIADYRTVRPEQMEPWRKTFIRWVNTVGELNAGMDPGWLTADLAESPYSSLARVMEEPRQMPSTVPRFARWLTDNGQSVPDPSTPSVPSGDGVVPIGPGHPGWADFWERARTAAGPGNAGYWRMLANQMGFTQGRERHTVQITVEVEVEAETGRDVHRVIDTAQQELMRGRFNRLISTGVSRTEALAG